MPVADKAVRCALLNLLVNSDALMMAIRAQSKNVPKDTTKDLEAAEKELKKLNERQARTLRLMNQELLTEDAAREELAIIKAARADAESRRQRAEVTPRAQSANPGDKALMAAAREMGAALREASMERMVELLTIICPPSEPYGISLTPSGIDIVGRLPVARRT